MRLPNAERAIVLAVKLESYLLPPAHPRGRGKALFFLSFGFRMSRPSVLERALLKHVLDHDVARTIETPHGVKYEIEGPMPAPDGRAPVVRSVWIIDTDGEQPRFVTAIPGERRSS